MVSFMTFLITSKWTFVEFSTILACMQVLTLHGAVYVNNRSDGVSSGSYMCVPSVFEWTLVE